MGLLAFIYYKNERIFRYFPSEIKQAIAFHARKVVREREGQIRIWATFPSFEGGKERQPAIMSIQLGILHEMQPLQVYQPSVAEENELVQFINNYREIFRTVGMVKGRVNYYSKAVIMWSYQHKEQTQGDTELIEEFHSKLNAIAYEYPPKIKQVLCEALNNHMNGAHSCEHCTETDEEGNTPDHESSDGSPIMENDPHGEERVYGGERLKFPTSYINLLKFRQKN